MAQAQIESRMKTTRIDVNGKKVTVGVLRKYGSTPLMEAPFAVKSFNEEHGTNVRLIRPTTADCLLVKTDNWREVTDAFPSPVSMAIAYEAPNTAIGDTIVLADKEEPRVVLANTGAAKGESNVAVVVQAITAKDINKEGNDYVINVPNDRLILVPGFPTSDGDYRTYKDTVVPSTSEDATGEERYLWRRDDNKYVGLVVRLDYYVNDRRRDVYASGRAANVLGVAVEVPEGDVAKICSNNGSPKEGPFRETPETTVVEILGQSPEQFKELVALAQENAGQLAGALNQTLFAPIQEVLNKVGEAVLKE